jgi:cytochrome c-type biogenesis protein CcmH
MTIFWILAAGLAVLALVFVLPPLLRRADGAPDLDRNALNLDVFRQQLAELDGDLALGKLDQDQYDTARRDLERELVHDLEPVAPAPTQAQPPALAPIQAGNQRLAAAVLALAIPAAAVALYLNIGAQEIIPKLEAANAAPVAQAQDPSGHATLPDGSPMPSLDVLAQQLAKRLEQKPDNPTGWLMLARTWFSLGDQGKGMAALERAYGVAPRQPEVLLAYAQALAEANDSQITGRPVELLDTLLAIEPGNLNGLWLRGMAAFQGGDFPGALTRWEPLLAALDPAGPDARELTGLMEIARTKAGLTGAGGSVAGQRDSAPAPTATATALQAPVAAAPVQPAPKVAPQQAQAPAARPAGLTVSVALDPALAPQTTPETIVFIYAKAVSGPPMPLAAQKVRVADLPVTLTLDDSMAMMPQMRLSAFPQVTVGARISRSGQAMPQSGDLEGEVSPIASGQAEPVAVTIGRVRP